MYSLQHRMHHCTCASLNGGMYAPPAGPAFKAGLSLGGSAAVGGATGAAAPGLRCLAGDAPLP